MGGSSSADGEGAAPSSIFVLTTELGAIEFSYMLTAVAIGLGVVEGALGWLEHRFKRRDETIKLAVMNTARLYLMLFGLTSFLLFMVLTSSPSVDWTTDAVFANAVILFAAIFLCCMGILQAYFVKPVRLRWKAAAVAAPEVLLEHARLLDADGRSSCQPSLQPEYRDLVAFHLFWGAFLRWYSSTLVSGNKFDFELFIQRVLDWSLVNSIQIQWYSWLGFVVCLTVSMGLHEWLSGGGELTLVELFVAGWVVFVLNSFSFWILGGVYHECLQVIQADAAASGSVEEAILQSWSAFPSPEKSQRIIVNSVDTAGRRRSSTMRAAVKQYTDCFNRYRIAGVPILSEKAYYFLLEECQLLQCFYMALYAVFGIGQALDEHSSQKGLAVLWILVLPLPIILSGALWSRGMLAKLALIKCLVPHDFTLSLIIAGVEEDKKVAERARKQVISKLLAAVIKLCGGNLAEEKVQAAADKIFAIFDINLDGSISKDELGKGLAKFHVYLTRSEKRALMRLIDQDKSNTLDRDEFRVFIASLTRDSSAMEAESVAASAGADLLEDEHQVFAYKAFLTSETTSRSFSTTN